MTLLTKGLPFEVKHDLLLVTHVLRAVDQHQYLLLFKAEDDQNLAITEMFVIEV